MVGTLTSTMLLAVRRSVSALRARQKIGKYRIEQRLAEGGFAAVYKALDTIEGIRVALKIPQASVMTPAMLRHFRSEVRLVAKLEHPNILPLKDASFIDGQFVIVFPLGERTLHERLHKRMSVETALDLMEQMLEGLAYAHRHRVIHCDIKPANFILFSGNRVRLSDFGIARVAQRTVRASGSGTLGHMAPEQAMGRPSLRSDVFSLGLIFYRMLSGQLPEWPFHWPLPGYRRLRRRVPLEFAAFLRKALEVDPRRRYRDADHMLAIFRKVKPLAMHYAAYRRRRQAV